MQNTDKQRIIHLIGVPDIEGDQVHRIVHRKNALICLFLLCTKNKNPRKVLIYRDFLCFAILSSGETGIRTPGTSQYNGFQDRRNRPLCHLSKTSFFKSTFC